VFRPSILALRAPITLESQDAGPAPREGVFRQALPELATESHDFIFQHIDLP